MLLIPTANVATDPTINSILWGIHPSVHTNMIPQQLQPPPVVATCANTQLSKNPTVPAAPPTTTTTVEIPPCSNIANANTVTLDAAVSKSEIENDLLQSNNSNDDVFLASPCPLLNLSNIGSTGTIPNISAINLQMTPGICDTNFNETNIINDIFIDADETQVSLESVEKELESIDMQIQSLDRKKEKLIEIRNGLLVAAVMKTPTNHMNGFVDSNVDALCANKENKMKLKQECEEFENELKSLKQKKYVLKQVSTSSKNDVNMNSNSNANVNMCTPLQPKERKILADRTNVDMIANDIENN